MRILIWHVHGSWTTSFVQGSHDYIVPVVPGRGPDGRGRAQTWVWPSSVVECDPEHLADESVDVVVLQRPEDEPLASQWLKRLPGKDIPAVYLEHNAPQGRISDLRHPAADRPDLQVVHVTHFNDLFWDCGTTRTRVIEHGIVDPGYRYTGELARAAVAINEPVRRARVTGTDLLRRFETAAPLDLFGMQAGELGGYEDLPQAELHDEMSRRRVYLHPMRWTSLGLSLLEAMHLGMPVVALGTTETYEAVPRRPASCPPTSTDWFERSEIVNDREQAQVMGKHARDAALDRYGLARFLADWDALLLEVTA